MENLGKLWSVSIEDAVSSLGSAHAGLTEQEAKDRLATYGKNSFNAKEKVSIFSLFLKQFVSPLIFLLIAAAILAIILGHWVDTIGIFFVVLVNVFLGLYHEYGAEDTLAKLTTYIKDRSKVIRDGKEEEIDSADLVPGDIIKLSYGSRVPADARIISMNNFLVDEAILTGESLPISKTTDTLPLTIEIPDRKNIAHAGTLVVQGYATAVVYATADKTEIGKIAGIVSGIKRSDTPLQKGVNQLAWLIFAVVIVLVIGIFILGVLRGEEILSMLILSSAVAVGAVPESLPITLTMILAMGATRIANKKGIVKKLAGAETLGSTTLIMTDKTGTLTKAQMELVGIYDIKNLLSTEPEKEKDSKTFSSQQKNMLEMALLNIDVTIENPNDDKADWVFNGRPFEVNLAKVARDHGVDFSVLLDTTTNLILPFNSTNKFSMAEQGGVLIAMGAPDILLRKSKMTIQEREKLEHWIGVTSRAGKRLMGIATLPKHNKVKNNKDIHLDLAELADLEFQGIFAFFDPIRPEVPQAIKNIESHGVKMVLITGDLVGTAVSVAKSLDWEVKDDEVITGSDVHSLSDAELMLLIPKIKIFARVTPEDKLRIGTLYQKLGEVVAMTGDGVNDAPALKAMDIGISLGSASDVAKSAADLVLLDDNFQTISLAIDEGRRILSNVKKSFVYLLATSFGVVFVIGGSLIMGIALPLTGLQIIWVNLFTGSLPGLAFAFDENFDKKRYVGKGSKLIFTNEVKTLTVIIGIVTSTLIFLLYLYLLRTGLEVPVARSIFFACFSLYVLVIAFSFRSLNKPLFSYSVFSNKRLNFSILISFGLLVFTMVMPFMRNLFGIDPLPLRYISFVIMWLVFNMLVVELIKYLTRKYYTKVSRKKQSSI